MRLAFNKFLDYCCNNKEFPSHWRPLDPKVAVERDDLIGKNKRIIKYGVRHGKKSPFNELGGLTLVDGKNTHEILKDPEAKHNLGLMLACCEAELERADIFESQPAPYYFKRAAILLNKQKEYDKEIKICELYCDSAKNFGIDVARSDI